MGKDLHKFDYLFSFTGLVILCVYKRNPVSQELVRTLYYHKVQACLLEYIITEAVFIIQKMYAVCVFV